MKFTYIPIQDDDGSWKMVAKLTEEQRRAADKARRRILNIKHDPDEWHWPLDEGNTMQVPLMYGTQLTVKNPRMNAILYGVTGV